MSASEDYLLLENIYCLAKLGCLPFEKIKPQRIVVDLKLFYDISQAAQSDQLEDAIDYSNIITEIENCSLKKHYNLLEHLAEELANHLLFNNKKLNAISLNIHKRQIMKNVGSASIHITRRQNNV